jgi:hypothetical protein
VDFVDESSHSIPSHAHHAGAPQRDPFQRLFQAFHVLRFEPFSPQRYSMRVSWVQRLLLAAAPLLARGWAIPSAHASRHLAKSSCRSSRKHNVLCSVLMDPNPAAPTRNIFSWYAQAQTANARATFVTQGVILSVLGDALSQEVERRGIDRTDPDHKPFKFSFKRSLVAGAAGACFDGFAVSSRSATCHPLHILSVKSIRILDTTQLQQTSVHHANCCRFTLLAVLQVPTWYATLHRLVPVNIRGRGIYMTLIDMMVFSTIGNL